MSTALAACGPFVVFEGETDSGSATGTGSSATDPSESDAAPVECNDASDCEPGHECIAHVCTPYDGCSDGGCCDYGECYDDECQTDEDCGPMGLCEGSSYGHDVCVYPEQLPECDRRPNVIDVPVPSLVGGEIVSLAFVDVGVDGREDFVIARSDGTELHPGIGDELLLPVPPGTMVVDAVSGDFDGDDDADIVASTASGTLLFMADDGGGAFPTAQETPIGPGLFDLAAVQWDDGDALDVAGVTPEGVAVLYLNDGAGNFAVDVALPTSGAVVSMAKSDYGYDEYDDLVVQDADTVYVFLGSASGDVDVDAYLPGEPHGERRLLAGHIDVVFAHEIIGYTVMDGWMLLELWANGADAPLRYAFPGDHTTAGMGDFDFDDDRQEDVIMRGESTMTLVRSTVDGLIYPSLACRTTYFAVTPNGAMAVGDHDGSNQADVVIESGGTVSFLLSNF